MTLEQTYFFVSTQRMNQHAPTTESRFATPRRSSSSPPACGRRTWQEGPTTQTWMTEVMCDTSRRKLPSTFVVPSILFVFLSPTLFFAVLGSGSFPKE
ncbi:hypothetical protein GGP99_000352 [Salinibacter ruber]|uniref:Transmembrane protein n=1 Tax=Salinibacter ruber TaxID=146919 RepID=A0AAW5P583_9BACT|nr:hypothetical protein [Salinibacter ruber]MCS4222773.1 hypothetical protein [Salinibacter ruber]